MIKPKVQMSESITLAILLSLAGGFQDAYSYNCRDQVFVNAQTGNVVLFGQYLATGQWVNCLHYLFPILAFLAGIYTTQWLRLTFRENEKLHWRQIVLGVEIALLGIVGLLPQSFNVLANILMSFACAMQVSGFQRFQEFSFATTMCIGNMRCAAETLCNYHFTQNSKDKRKSLYYFFIILVFIVGAAGGAVMTKYVGEQAIWVSGVLLLAGFVMMFVREEEEEKVVTESWE